MSTEKSSKVLLIYWTCLAILRLVLAIADMCLQMGVVLHYCGTSNKDNFKEGAYCSHFQWHGTEVRIRDAAAEPDHRMGSCDPSRLQTQSRESERRQKKYQE